MLVNNLKLLQTAIFADKFGWVDGALFLLISTVILIYGFHQKTISTLAFMCPICGN